MAYLRYGGAIRRAQWAVVMSRNSGYSHQCVELDFQYSSEGVHRRWDEGTCNKWDT